MSGDEEEGPLPRPLPYIFAYRSLPEAAYQNHPELIREFTNGPGPLPLLHFRSKAIGTCMDVGQLPENLMDDDEAFDAATEVFRDVAWQSYSISDLAIYVVTMPKPEISPEAYYAAIVHLTTEPHNYMEHSPSTRYLTLELSPEGNALLCEIFIDGSRANYGECDVKDPDGFAHAVIDVLAGRRRPELRTAGRSPE